MKESELLEKIQAARDEVHPKLLHNNMGILCPEPCIASVVKEQSTA